MKVKNIAVLVSGGGTNLQAIIDAYKAGKITNGRLALVLSSNEKAYALERAANNGIEIPNLCYNGQLKLYGACGLCLVEAEGMPKLMRACATVAQDGMVLSTKTPRVEKARKIASVCYEMKRMFFSIGYPYTFASEVPEALISYVKENSATYPGVDVSVVPVREYLDGTLAPHVLGRIGAIDADEYKKLKEEGYKITDLIGKSGIELAMEEYLKGNVKPLADLMRASILQTNREIASFAGGDSDQSLNSIYLVGRMWKTAQGDPKLMEAMGLTKEQVLETKGNIALRRVMLEAREAKRDLLEHALFKRNMTPEQMKQAGIAYATQQIIDLYANGINAVHVYSMNKPDVAKTIQENVSAIIK